MGTPWADMTEAQRARKREADARFRANHREKDLARKRAWASANPNRLRAAADKWVASNPEARLNVSLEWKKRNAPQQREYKAAWAADNRPKRNHCEAKRRGAAAQATPKWLTEKQHSDMEEIYATGRALGLHVDHIVPLMGKTVCGLHVPWNLQLLPPAANMSKGNRI